MSIEAMKQALDALEEHGTHYARHEDNYIKAITALREAIEQAEMVKKGTKAWADTPDGWVDDLRGDMPDHFRGITKKVVPSDHTNSHQPVAWREVVGKTTHYYDYNEDGRGEPLYAALREWVGLTDHELQVLDFNDPERGKLARAVEAKLKERNT